MGVVAEGIPRGCQGLFTPVSLGYPLSVFNKNSTLERGSEYILAHTGPRELDGHTNWASFDFIVAYSSC